MKQCRDVQSPHPFDLQQTICHFYARLVGESVSKQAAFSRCRIIAAFLLWPPKDDHRANSKWAFKRTRLSLDICLSRSCTYGSFLFFSSQLLIYEGIKYDTCVTDKSPTLGLNHRLTTALVYPPLVAAAWQRLPPGPLTAQAEQYLYISRVSEAVATHTHNTCAHTRNHEDKCNARTIFWKIWKANSAFVGTLLYKPIRTSFYMIAIKRPSELGRNSRCWQRRFLMITCGITLFALKVVIKKCNKGNGQPA